MYEFKIPNTGVNLPDFPTFGLSDFSPKEKHQHVKEFHRPGVLQCRT
jgi:hypothetical protein